MDLARIGITGSAGLKAECRQIALLCLAFLNELATRDFCALCHMPMSNSFSAHLIEVCSRPVNLPVFLEGYAEVLNGVARGGTFEVHGLTLDAPPGVYSPHETSSTRFFMDHFFALGLDRPAGRFLDVGCGAGGIGLLAARSGWRVTACDVDPIAVKATLVNADRNGLVLEARQSDLFSAFSDSEKFDVIAFNLPFFHLDREITEQERTLSDFGGRLYARFMCDAKQHLTPGGRVVFTYSNCSNTAIFSQPGWAIELRAFDFDGGSDYIRAIFSATPD